MIRCATSNILRYINVINVIDVNRYFDKLVNDLENNDVEQSVTMKNERNKIDNDARNDKIEESIIKKKKKEKKEKSDNNIDI